MILTLVKEWILLVKSLIDILPFILPIFTLCKTKSSKDGDKILELDRIPYYAQSIQQVLSYRIKLKYFLTHNVPLVIDILTSYDLIKAPSTATRFEYSLFTYEVAEPLKGRMLNQKLYGANGMLHYDHIITNMDIVEIGPNL